MSERDPIQESVQRLQDGNPKTKHSNTIHGAQQALCRLPGIEHFYFDEMMCQKRVAQQVPWLHGTSESFPRPVTDLDYIDATKTLTALGMGDFSKNHVIDALASICSDRPINPVKDYLKSLTWDGVERLSELGFTLFGVKNPMQLKYVRRWMVAAVERALRPGTQAGAVLTLIGTQGFGKTSFLNVLFKINGTNYHDENLPDPSGLLGAAPAKRHIQSFWCVSAGELHMLKKSELGALKLFLTEIEDTFDEKYKQELTRRPRRCVFAGTSNERQVLADPTGNRRFWMLDVVKAVPLDWLEANRDHLWAEAYHAWKAGEAPNIDPSDYEASAQVAEDFTDLPDWVADLENYLEDEGNPEEIKCSDLYTAVMGVDFDAAKEWLRTKQLITQMSARGYHKRKVKRNGKQLMAFTRGVQ